MAGDWIKMRSNLWDDPRVARLCDITDSGEAAIVGALYWLWSAADQHSEDGVMPGLTMRSIDRKTGVHNFGSALVTIGWLEEHPHGMRIIRFEEHNGSSAKRRCVEARRKMSARDADKKQTVCSTTTDELQQSCAPREREREREREYKPTTTTKNTVIAPASVPSSSPDLHENRGKTLASRLSKLEAARTGKEQRYSGADPRVQAWVAAGITDPMFREAYEIAVNERITAEDTSPVNPGFLDIFIAKLANPSDASGSVSRAKKVLWYETASGIEAKGKELGVPPPDVATGGFPAFKARVFSAVGLSPGAAKAS